jgi:hypothetical protein
MVSRPSGSSVCQQAEKEMQDQQGWLAPDC